MVLITPRLVRALEPDEVPPLPTLPRRFLPSPDVEKGAPGNPTRPTRRTGVEAREAGTSTWSTRPRCRTRRPRQE